VVQRFGFQFSSPQPTPLSTGHSLLAPPSDESAEPSGPYLELVGCLMYLMTTLGMGILLGGRGLVVLTGHADASWVDDSATQRSSQCYTFSLGSDSVSWRSTFSSSALKSSCEAEIYQCSQLCLAYVATRANTADIFTKALPPGDHQRFSTVLGLLALLFLTGLVTTCSPPLCLWGLVLIPNSLLVHSFSFILLTSSSNTSTTCSSCTSSTSCSSTSSTSSSSSSTSSTSSYSTSSTSSSSSSTSSTSSYSTSSTSSSGTSSNSSSSTSSTSFSSTSSSSTASSTTRAAPPDSPFAKRIRREILLPTCTSTASTSISSTRTSSTFHSSTTSTSTSSSSSPSTSCLSMASSTTRAAPSDSQLAKPLRQEILLPTGTSTSSTSISSTSNSSTTSTSTSSTSKCSTSSSSCTRRTLSTPRTSTPRVCTPSVTTSSSTRVHSYWLQKR
ncbi:unnamed protein product, partial [Closterium sp. NIES-53]